MRGRRSDGNGGTGGSGVRGRRSPGRVWAPPVSLVPMSDSTTTSAASVPQDEDNPPGLPEGRRGAAALARREAEAYDARVPGFRTAPPDDGARAALASDGLRLAVVDPADEETVVPWLLAGARGFHSGENTPEQTADVRPGVASRRLLGVWDDGGGESVPVGTLDAWPGELSLPGERTVTAWAISFVTVAPTHRRRGIARALIEGELRTAARLGSPLAMLTVSESSIYGRFGFSPAALATDWTIDTRRARWTGPHPAGRIDFVSREAFRGDVALLHERGRRRHPGSIDVWGRRWDQMAGLVPEAQDAGNLRAVRYRDAAGETRGAALFRVTEREEDFTRHSLSVLYLVSDTADAYAALWRLLLETDLVSTVTAHLRSVDEPLRWMIADQRAAEVRVWEHQYLRILDVAASFGARAYAAAGRLALEVSDPLGFTEGVWLIDAGPGGCATVERLPALDDAPADAAAVSLTANELGSLLLGGVSAVTLAAAGRVVEVRPGSAVAADALLRSPQTPWLSIWY